MLNQEVKDILSSSADAGWVMEPEAKRLLRITGINVPDFIWVKDRSEIESSASEIGFPLVAKVVSDRIIHKSDSNGVVIGIDNPKSLEETFDRFSKFEGFSGMLVEETLSGIELIIGAKVDYQFGPVILFGIGGTGVEIYRDTTLRMAPLNRDDVDSMVKCLKAHKLLQGYRGSDPIDMMGLTNLMIKFSELAMGLENVMDSIDLNPVMCAPERCVVADARIMLKSKENK